MRERKNELKSRVFIVIVVLLLVIVISFVVIRNVQANKVKRSPLVLIENMKAPQEANEPEERIIYFGFEGFTIKGNKAFLPIKNNESNKCDMVAKVQLLVNDEYQTIYTSHSISPGYGVGEVVFESIPLSGEYDGLVSYTAITRNGKHAMPVNLKIKIFIEDGQEEEVFNRE